MKKAEYYINVVQGKINGEYPKVSGYVESVTDSKGISTLVIGYDKRCAGRWRATEMNTGFCVSNGAFETKEKCVENVHNNIDIIVEIYNKRMTDDKYYHDWIKPFEDFVNANGGLNND